MKACAGARRRRAPADAAQLRLRVVNATRRRIPSRPVLRRWVLAALPGRGRWEVGVRVVGPAESARLNRRYRAKPHPTNVLSFPYARDPVVNTCFLGDLVICAALVAAEARAASKPPMAHWAHLVVHGILHLRGYDHISEPEARVMEATEARVLRRLGFTNPYLPTP